MNKLELRISLTQSELKQAEKAVVEYVEQIKRYAEYMKEETQPFKVWDTADSIARWNKHLQESMRKVSELNERLQFLEYLAEDGD